MTLSTRLSSDTTDNHRYEAVFLQPVKAGVDTMYSVANRRLGTTDVKVTKNWNDGDEKPVERDKGGS